MSALDLLNKTQVEFVNSPFAVGESITYKHQASLLVEAVKAFVDGNDYNSKDKDKTENTCVFSNVVLAEVPSKLDVITYDNLVWNVREWYISNGMYVITTDNEKRNTVSKRSFR